MKYPNYAKLNYRDKKQFRYKVSISQAEMARYLGISLSQLAMSEKNKRSIPTAAFIKLAELEIAYEKSKASKKAGTSLQALQQSMNTDNARTADKLLNRVRAHKSKAALLKSRLDYLANRHENDKCWLNFVDKQLALPSEDKTLQVDKRWLKEQHSQVSKRLLKTNREMGKLRFDIELLHTVANIHEAHGKKLKKGIG